jgi:hypothetical protein
MSTKFKLALREANNTVKNDLMDLSTLKPEERKRILVICRTGYETYQSIKIKRSIPNEPDNFFDFENASRTEDGDGRVPDVSSCHYHNSVLTLVIKDAFFYKDYSHGFILKDERVQKLVNRFLFGKTKFDFYIPGSTVKQIRGLKQTLDLNDLPCWEIVT